MFSPPLTRGLSSVSIAHWHGPPRARTSARQLTSSFPTAPGPLPLHAFERPAWSSSASIFSMPLMPTLAFALRPPHRRELGLRFRASLARLRAGSAAAARASGCACEPLGDPHRWHFPFRRPSPRACASFATPRSSPLVLRRGQPRFDLLAIPAAGWYRFGGLHLESCARARPRSPPAGAARFGGSGS